MDGRRPVVPVGWCQGSSSRCLAGVDTVYPKRRERRSGGMMVLEVMVGDGSDFGGDGDEIERSRRWWFYKRLWW